MTFYASRLAGNLAVLRTLTLKTQDHLLLNARSVHLSRRCCSRSRLIFSGKRDAREACHRRPSQQRHSLENSLASVHAWMSGAPYPMLLASGGRVHIVLALAAMSPSCFIQLVSSGKPFAGLAEMCEPALSNFTCKLSWQMSDGR